MGLTTQECRAIVLELAHHTQSQGRPFRPIVTSLSLQRTLCGAKVSTSVVAAQTVPPGDQPGGTAPTPPTSTSSPGYCNSQLPSDTVLDRFLWTINFLVQNGFYVVLDNQFNFDQTAINNQAQWLQRVSSLLPTIYLIASAVLIRSSV
jgi:hypothetical protein